jgi:hypothetical protein
MSDYRGILITSFFLFLLVLILFYGIIYETSKRSYDEAKVMEGSYSSYCPVSSLLRSQLKYDLAYPIDIVDPSNQPRIKAKDIWNCTSSEIQSMKVFHQCSRYSRCPISLSNIQAARNRSSSWHAKHSLCYWKQNHRSSNTTSLSNIIFLGGSVTMGAGAADCCCDGRIEPKCQPFDYQRWAEKGCGPLEARYCRWSTLFMSWIREAWSHKPIHEIFLAVGGATSPYMSEQFAYQLALHDIHELTSNDIVFIDHSVNDGMVYDSKIRSEQLVQGLESLILRILHMSRMQAWPTIILLEMWPYHGPIMDLAHRPVIQGSGIDPYDYRFIYEKVAAEYEIPIWSYRDIVWSIEADRHIHPMNQKMVEYLRFLHNPEFAYQHPPWFIHLYYADIIAGLMQRELTRCDEDDRSSRKIAAMNLSALVSDPAHHIVEMENCLMDVKPLIDQYSELVFHRKQSAIYTTSPSSSWKLMSDRHEKYGWIDQNHHHEHDQINRSSSSFSTCGEQEKYISNLTFPFDSSSMAYSGSHSAVIVHVDL